MKVGLRAVLSLPLILLLAGSIRLADAADLKNAIRNLHGGQGILLEPLPLPFPSQESRFQASSLQRLDQLNSQLTSAIGVPSFNSSVTGFTFDIECGVPVRTTESLGTLLTERATTLGARKLDLTFTGGSMNVPIEQQIALLKKASPQVRRIGVIYDPSKTGFLVKQAERIARDQGVRLLAKAIASPKDSFAALDATQGEIDALWILPDVTVLAPESVQYMLLFSFRNRIPLLCLSENQARMGAPFGLSFGSGRDIGIQAGEIANEILSGRRAEEIPFTTARRLKLTVNLKTAGKLGLQVPKEILDRADVVIR